MDKKIKRINELAKKAREEGLTDAEKAEQQQLRADYIAAFRKSFRAQLENTDVEYDDGEVIPLAAFKKPKNKH